MRNENDDRLPNSDLQGSITNGHTLCYKKTAQDLQKEYKRKLAKQMNTGNNWPNFFFF